MGVRDLMWLPWTRQSSRTRRLREDDPVEDVESRVEHATAALERMTATLRSQVELVGRPAQVEHPYQPGERGDFGVRR